MKVARLCAGVSLSIGVALALAAGCAGDDKKLVARDGGAGGEGGEGLLGGGPASGGSQGSGASGGSSTSGAAGDGASGGGATADGGSGVGGESSGGAAVAGEGGSGASAGGSGAAGSDSGEAGAGGVATSEPTPVPSSCTGCASDFCVAARVACQSDATCASCRDVDYTAPACAQNTAFQAWLTCICATGCSATCASVCP